MLTVVRGLVEAAAQTIEAVAVAIIVVVIAVATAHYVTVYVRGGAALTLAYDEYRHRVGRAALLLTLEILVAADIIRTVAQHTAEPRRPRGSRGDSNVPQLVADARGRRALAVT